MSGYDKSEPKASLISFYIVIVVLLLIITFIGCWFAYKSLLKDETLKKYNSQLTMERLELKAYEQSQLNSWKKEARSATIQVPKEKAKELIIKHYKTN